MSYFSDNTGMKFTISLKDLALHIVLALYVFMVDSNEAFQLMRICNLNSYYEASMVSIRAS